MFKCSIYVLSFALFFVTLNADDAIRPMTQDLPKFSPPTVKLVKETTLLDHLIDATVQNLESQRELKNLLVQYVQLQEEYSKNTQDKGLSYRLIKEAHELLGKIQDQHLIHVFDQEFISELTFFSNIAAKWNSPK